MLDISAERSSVWKLKLHLVAHSLRQPQIGFRRFSLNTSVCVIKRYSSGSLDIAVFLDDYRQINEFKNH